VNIMKIVKERRYETVCVVLVLVLLLALIPVRMLAGKVKQDVSAAQDMLSKAGNLLNYRPYGQQGLANGLPEARKAYAQAVTEETNKTVELFETKNQRKFLIEGMFPEAKSNLWTFRADYNQKINDLLKTMNAGWPADLSGMTGGPKPSEIGLYVRRDNLSIGEWADANDQPKVEDCWFGQLDLWIQQDLAEVFRDLNQDAADSRAQQPRVENAAVKQIVGITVYPYFYTAKPATTTPVRTPFGSGISASPPMPTPNSGFNPYAAGASPFPTDMTPSSMARPRQFPIQPFTEHTTDKTAYVVHFSFSVVVDSRQVNAVLAALSHKNLYNILGVSLSRQDIDINTTAFPKFNREQVDFNPHTDTANRLVYGTDPIVMMDVQAEALFLKSFYDEYVPAEVKASMAEAAGKKQTTK